MNWETKRFSQVMTITKGEAITKASEKEGIYPVILGGQEPAYYINRYNHTGKAIVISRSGASAGYASFWNEPIFVTDGFIVEPKDNNRYEYIYYLLKFFEKALHDLQNGSAIPHVTPKTIFNLKAPIPPEIVQSRIIEFLSAYDKLIELNNKRIKVLEQMAENLYKEWFVRFRFPGHEKVEFENGLPKGWKVWKIKNVVKRLPFNRTYKEFELEKEGKVIVIDQSTDEYLGFHNNAPSHKANYNKPILLFGDHSCKFQIMTCDFSLGENVIPFTTNDSERVDDYWLFYATHKLIVTEEYKRHWGRFSSMKILVPDVCLQRNFASFMRRIEKEKNALHQESSLLSRQRDLLLPRLMSGKLEV